ncbi:Response regulator receiver domain-containing protein [Erythrobacter sp. HL-111]|nr:MAG: Response regulator receiver domain [Erythrobacteraceae bacterium HL-111]SDS59348.1 Response regulator receiver domain-containing protein [Erythrobacter sp. HL-111]
MPLRARAFGRRGAAIAFAGDRTITRTGDGVRRQSLLPVRTGLSRSVPVRFRPGRGQADRLIEALGNARIVTAPDVRTALARLAEEEEAFDLALIDLGLPDGSGIEVLRALKARDQSALGVVATILGDDASVVAALAAGADGYLLKDQDASGRLKTAAPRQKA